MRAFIVLALIAAVRADAGGYSYGAGSHLGGSNGAAGHYGGDVSGGHGAGPVATEYHKEFFTYSAPEGDFDAGQNLGDVASSLKQNLRVIFIKGPENNGLENAALNLAKSAGDSRTAIYVLNKQGDISDLANKLQNLNTHNGNKPEVHFVKYRTPEDAANAQRQIQAQYDGLPGNTQSHNGGVAPVLNFASAAPHAPHNTYIPPTQAVHTPSDSYLPIFKK